MRYASTRMKICGGSGAVLALFAFLAVAACAQPAVAGGREIVGTIVKIDPAEGTFSVTDGMGVRWNYKVVQGAEVDLWDFREGDRVEVSIARATPLNMMSAADYFRKGDRIVKIPY
ncbi:MAG: hypothetical protein HY896_08055 [Deltaproteobacteria bacterium]|nr:hypothetical protein [Deltaproteobacteria bacterium]